MEIEKKLSNLAQLVIQSEQKKVLPQKTQNALLGRVSTLSFILSESKIEALPDIYKKMLKEVLDDLELNLKTLNKDGPSLFAKLYNWLPGSNLSKVQGAIPKLLELSDKIASTASVHKYIEKTINTKRKADRPAGDDEDQDTDEFKAATQGYKKIKTNDDNFELNTNTPSSATSTTKIINKSNSAHPFSLKILCSSDLEPYIPANCRVKVPKPSETSITIKREDFCNLPKNAVFRLSKEHVLISAKPGQGANIIYQITDLSVNGVFFLGNRIENSYMKRPPERLKKDTPYNIRNGDAFGILMNKDTQNKDMTLGFEFVLN